jgi:hypothetical protein
MVIATITSGLGNQLFQYALGRQISHTHKSALYFDLHFYKTEYSRRSQRTFKLDQFNIKFKAIDKKHRFFMAKTRFFPHQTLHPIFATENERYYHFNPDVLKVRDYFVILKGFWQSEKYFDGITQTIREEVQFNNKLSPEFNYYKRLILGTENSISVHVRRKDYVNNPKISQSFGFIGLDYYKSAIEIMKNTLLNCRFFVFTDDKDWVLRNFPKDDSFVFVKNTGVDADLDDMHLMMLCKNQIIANSSFSWWGAWLNDNPVKIVLAPKIWFKNQPDWDTKDLIPTSWRRL